MLKKLIDWLFASAPVEEIPNTPPTLTEAVQPRPKKNPSENEWVRNRRGAMPIDGKTLVEVVLRNGHISRGFADGFDWSIDFVDGDIMRFRKYNPKPRTTKRAAALVADKSESQRKPKAKPAKRKPTTKGAKTMAKKKGCKPKGK